MAQYTLNVKVLKAENLIYKGQPATNIRTFVRLHLHNHNKFYCTEGIDNDPNPNWNEDLGVTSYEPNVEELCVEVLCEELNRSVLIAQPYQIPLKTLEIGGNTIAPADLDLKLDDQPVGTLHLELKLAESPEPAPKFNGPVLLRVSITDAKGVTEQVGEEEDGEENHNNDTYLLFLLKGHDTSETIKTIVNKTSSDPAWNQSFSVICEDPAHDVLTFTMVSGDVTIIPEESIVIDEMEPYTRSSQKFDFSKDGGEEEGTGGHLTIEYGAYDLNDLSKKPVNIHLKVLNGKNLLKKDADKSDPYVKVSVGDTEFSTEAQQNTLNPEWNQEFDFVSNDPIHDKLTLKLLDKDVAVDDKMMDDIVFPVRDIKTTENKEPLLYKVPLRENGKPAGLLSFEILAEGQCLQVFKPEDHTIVEFTVLEASFGKPVRITYGTHSHEEDPPTLIKLNEKEVFRCDNPKEDFLILVFENDDEEEEGACDPVQISLGEFGFNGESRYTSDVYLEDQKTGHIDVLFWIGQESVKKKEENQPPEPEVKTRDAPIIQDEYCDFLWGTYGSSYSTSFTGYSNCTPLSSTLSDAEIKYHHKHPILDKDTTKPKRRSETLSGAVGSVELTSQNDAFVVGDKYYATATLYGKSSRSSSKLPPLRSDEVEAQDAKTLSLSNLPLNFDSKLKKGDFIEVNLFHQSDNQQIGKSTIALEKVEPSEEEKPVSFPLNECKLVKDPAQIGNLNVNLKHTVQFQ